LVMQCLRLHAAPSATADRARRAKFPPCGSILIRAAQTRRQRPQPSHPRSQGAGKRRFVIAESAEGLRVVGEAPAASPRWPRSAAHHCVRLGSSAKSVSCSRPGRQPSGNSQCVACGCCFIGLVKIVRPNAHRRRWQNWKVVCHNPHSDHCLIRSPYHRS
jgi:hypothetical protein